MSDRGRLPRYTRAELAWLLIGGYWIALALLATARLPVGPALGILPLLAALVLGLFGPRPGPAEAKPPAWTHHAALVLLWTWPLAWIALILVSKARL